MAFHNPNPKLRKLEQQNARLRAETFAWLFGTLWGKSVNGVRRLVLRCRKLVRRRPWRRGR
jgi:hypothetical protein